jgi:uncharacterized protein (DUF1810 family)
MEPKMMKENDTAGDHDPFPLSRFTEAQNSIYDTVLAELGNGEKRTHWMWFIFPQIDGLGHSPAAKYYAIKSIEEARQYLKHPVLGKRLVQCAEAVLAVEGRSASEIFGYPDDMKLKSSMTLFALVAEPQSIFSRVLAKYFRGERDVKTLSLAEETGKRRNT